MAKHSSTGSRFSTSAERSTMSEPPDESHPQDTSRLSISPVPRGRLSPDNEANPNNQAAEWDSPTVNRLRQRPGMYAPINTGEAEALCAPTTMAVLLNLTVPQLQQRFPTIQFGNQGLTWPQIQQMGQSFPGFGFHAFWPNRFFSPNATDEDMDAAERALGRYPQVQQIVLSNSNIREFGVIYTSDTLMSHAVVGFVQGRNIRFQDYSVPNSTNVTHQVTNPSTGFIAIWWFT
ncbi:hypothetical protein AYO21_05060 [Fonsecaea monophora]|uniref:Uncharacterized protein n=1 Tax=Fonsecaea monophora TaxID=254056 RepID=A0A177FBF4_9EURO|nr:hypothetical protein AYO21_05060 [Fonsecaea monophora]KAH0837571.1 hypothetical protein FOPE_05196 [Fonsecaea pedrosoi]OAG40762.1 hypothetical protein AYO21_05060 [Fonsecaea monophora]